MLVALLTLVTAAPSVQVEACPEAWLDAKQVRARLSLDPSSSDVALTVRCLGGLEVRISHGTAKTTLTLTGATAAQRERTLALFIATWLEPKPEPRRAPRPRAPTPEAPPEPPDAGEPELIVEAPPEPPPPPPLVPVEPEPAPAPAPEPVKPADNVIPPPVETLVPVELGLVPRVGLNRLFPSPTRNHLALGLLGVSSDAVDGLSLAPLSLVDATMSGVQLGLVSAAGRVEGLQFGALFTTVATTTRGAQLSISLSITREHLTGFQFGMVDVAGGVTGMQLGILNVGEDVTGVQLGLVNFARTVRGTQIGLLNFAKHAAAPVGAFNVNEDAPLRLALFTSDTSALGVSIETGGTWLYGIVSLGWLPSRLFRAGGGLGLHFGAVRGTGFFFEVEATAHGVVDADQPTFTLLGSYTLGAQVGYRFFPRFGLFLGPQLTLLTGARGSLFSIPLGTSGLSLAPGGMVGIEL